MGETPRRLLLADTAPASRAVLEPVIRDQGWELLSVESSFQVLPTVRDANVDLVLIAPDLPGSGVTGADVARTLKGATQFRHVPVLFLLHGGRQPPAGIPVDGSIELDHWDPARILHTIKQSLGLADAWPDSVRVSVAPEGSPISSEASLARPLTDLIERLTARLESRLSQIDEQERRFREEALSRVSAAAQQFFLTEGPAAIRQEIRDQVREVVERAVAEVAREMVPEVAERLIAEEIARLRRDYGVK
ncbi:MAG: hypothetical protein HY725_12020 [Candidatus Rokubacteria bacterium]|nr:hypothetical protein [Candidatus Rokubacteria bacterium]